MSTLFAPIPLSPEAAAEVRVNSLLGIGRALPPDATDAQKGLAIIATLKGLWCPNGTTTALMLAALGTRAVPLFEHHAAAVAELWGDAQKRLAFITLAFQHYVRVTADNASKPVFEKIIKVRGQPDTYVPIMLPYTPHQDGTITLNV